MRIAYQFLVIAIVGLFLTGCSGVKLANSYKSDSFETIQNQKVLVISRTPIEDVRKAYELEITRKLRARGVNAVASHIAFPDLKRIDNKTVDRIAKVIATFRKNGFDVVVLTSLKDVQEQEVMQKQGGYSSLMDYYGNHYVTLKGYYDDLNAPPRLPPREVPEETTYRTETTYVLEAVTYNLALEEEKRLVSVTTAEVTDPDSGPAVRKGFAKIVADQLK
ncbi:hypothetical protein [Ulvibacterium marinum]|uniref:DUF4136 domain-containing protein n=1 Tax=Ulvibacterium marinum TaxID=2419782 RepID=A0A3B0C501_9FLAO|nr:hypothetical protein [Ulvibacterium marinum]RKN81385.1 hypothetical protein D7Z94_10670 [Ulvibacterium marinum]